MKVKTLIVVCLLICTTAIAQEKKEIFFNKGTLNLCLQTTVKIKGYDGDKIIIETDGKKNYPGFVWMARRSDSIYRRNYNSKYAIKKASRGLDQLGNLKVNPEDNPYYKSAKIRADKRKKQRYLIIEESNGFISLVEKIIENPTGNYILAGRTFDILIPNSLKLQWNTTECENQELTRKLFWAPSLWLEDFSGEVEITTENGNIMLEDVSGPITANTLNGKIEAEFNSVLPSNICSLISHDGSIKIELPKKSEVTIDATAFSIFSNLDFQVKSEEVNAGKKKMKLQLNNGKTRMKVDAGYGNVYLRRN